MEGGVAVIGLDRSESADPSYLTAIIAHELGHVRLLAERRISAGRRDHERLTDLLTVYFGFGIFSANAALDYAEAARSWSVHPLGELDERTLNAARNHGYRRLGCLSEHEFGYTLACYCWLREEREEPRWGLPPDPPIPWLDVVIAAMRVKWFRCLGLRLQTLRLSMSVGQPGHFVLWLDV